MRYKINLQIDQALARRVEAKIIRAAARAALEHAAAPAPGEITIAITDDRALQRLNHDFLGHDYATDVLSFPSEAARPVRSIRPDRPIYLGDIAISFPRAHAQAEAGSHPLSAEVQLLVVHGVLHLLGYDHARPKEKTRMWAAQAEILQQLKAPITSPSTPSRHPNP